MSGLKYYAILFLGLILLLTSSTEACTNVTKPLVQALPSDLQTIELSVFPPEAKVGDNVTVTAEVRNVGNVDANCTVNLNVNGTHEAALTTPIAANGSKIVSFVVSPDKPGRYTATVGLLSQTFMIVNDLPSFNAEQYGENTYDVTYIAIFKNNGPGPVQPFQLRVALITTREPYQKVLSINTTPTNYKTTEDKYGNSIAEFEFDNIEAGKYATVEINYQVVASRLIYNLDPCKGQALTEFLQPEPYIESDNANIIALAKQITQGKTNDCEKARAIYNWIVNNINYTGYSAEVKGALYCLNNKGGDCTEFSCLTIALCRAAGIPARFVEGVTGYPTTDTINHDWAQIYLPGIGWVPVDDTYGKFADKREENFAQTDGKNIIYMIGSVVKLGKFIKEFQCSEYHYVWPAEKPNVSFHDTWEIRTTGRSL
jgi:transglutaminase-like putative cysteine protease